jgi:uncharacterized protein DUF3108
MAGTDLQSAPEPRPDKPDKSVSLAPRNPFTVGERLAYEVSWSDFIVAGELTLENKERLTMDGVDAFHVIARARSIGVVSAVALKVDDTYDSFVDAATLKPFRAEKRSRHGKKREESMINIDQNRRKASLSNGRLLDLPVTTYDLASLLYAIRGMDLTIGKAATFDLIEDDKLYQISVMPEAREKITTQAGSFDVMRLGTKMPGGKRNDKLYNLQMYITVDARRLPVQITAQPSWGEVRVSLTSTK